MGHPSIQLACHASTNHIQVMRRSEAIKILGQHAASLKAMGAKSLYLFGSTARDKSRDHSDVDIFIEPDKTRPFSLIDLVQMKDICGRPCGKMSILRRAAVFILRCNGTFGNRRSESFECRAPLTISSKTF